MVNLIIVSHSLHLAQGVKELADEMLHVEVNSEQVSVARPQIFAVGGIEEEDNTRRLGTNALEIAGVIQQAWSKDGVLIFVDLGSSLLNAEMAIEMLDEAMQASCRVSNAPLVEGSVIATMEASLGGTLAQVEEAATTACQMIKNTHSGR